MTLRLHLPLGNPPAGTSASASAAQLQALAAQLTLLPGAFAADRTALQYRLPASAPAALRKVSALWGGTLDPQEDEAGMATLELGPGDAAQLWSRLPARAPVPRRVTFGPFQLAPDVSAALRGGAPSTLVEAGAPLGNLQGTTFTLAFEDQNGFWIDPAWCLRQFSLSGLWHPDLPAVLPIVPPGPQPAEIAVAGPARAPSGTPHLVLFGGSRRPPLRVFAPPAELPPDYLSFLSGDELTVGVFHFPAAGSSSLRVDDLTAGTARNPGGLPFLSPPGPDASTTFSPQRDLRPSHPAYAPGAGSADPSEPLRYRVTMDVREATGTRLAPLASVVTQDLIDTVRQEYVFHGPPYQGGAPLAVPARERFHFVTRPARTLADAGVHAHNNYLARGVGLEGNGLSEAYRYIRRRYRARLYEAGSLSPADARHTSCELLFEGWRNPERNEAMRGAIDDPHQHGAFVTMKPFHRHLNRELFPRLWNASVDFLSAFDQMNPAGSFTRLEAALVQGDRVLWLWRQEGALGTGGPGIDYAAVVGGGASVNEAGAVADAVVLRWIPARPALALAYPNVAAYPAFPTASRRTNLIAIGTEAPGTPPGDQIPVDDAGETLRAHLASLYPGDDTRLIEVTNPVQLLEAMGAFPGDPVSIRYLFTLSHAWPGGLNLVGGFQPEDPVGRELLKKVYGPRFAIGANDMSQFRTWQFRPANVLLLPEEMKERLRAAVAASEGIFFLGCNTGTVNPNAMLAQEIATALDRPVWGENYYSKFYSQTPTGFWIPHHQSRGSNPTGEDVVLLPAYPGLELNGYVGDVEYVDFYRRSTTRFDPLPAEKGE